MAFHIPFFQPNCFFYIGSRHTFCRFRCALFKGNTSGKPELRCFVSLLLRWQCGICIDGLVCERFTIGFCVDAFEMAAQLVRRVFSICVCFRAHNTYRTPSHMFLYRWVWFFFLLAYKSIAPHEFLNCSPPFFDSKLKKERFFFVIFFFFVSPKIPVSSICKLKLVWIKFFSVSKVCQLQCFLIRLRRKFNTIH